MSLWAVCNCLPQALALKLPCPFPFAKNRPDEPPHLLNAQMFVLRSKEAAPEARACVSMARSGSSQTSHVDTRLLPERDSPCHLPSHHHGSLSQQPQVLTQCGRPQKLRNGAKPDGNPCRRLQAHCTARQKDLLPQKDAGPWPGPPAAAAGSRTAPSRASSFSELRASPSPNSGKASSVLQALLHEGHTNIRLLQKVCAPSRFSSADLCGSRIR